MFKNLKLVTFLMVTAFFGMHEIRAANQLLTDRSESHKENRSLCYAAFAATVNILAFAAIWPQLGTSPARLKKVAAIIGCLSFIFVVSLACSESPSKDCSQSSIFP
jgi:hypothetical protein